MCFFGNLREVIENKPPIFSCTVESGTPPYTYSWNFGDGSSSASKNPVHTYTNPGEYIANVTVTDSINQKASKSMQIKVYESPVGTVPDPPVLNLHQDDNIFTLNWTTPENSDGFTLIYTLDGEDINYLDFGSKTSLQLSFKEEMAVYVAVNAYNDYGQSELSNVVFIDYKPEQPVLPLSNVYLSHSISIKNVVQVLFEVAYMNMVYL